MCRGKRFTDCGKAGGYEDVKGFLILIKKSCSIDDNWSVEQLFIMATCEI